MCSPGSAVTNITPRAAGEPGHCCEAGHESARLADVAEWEHGAVTPVVAELGPPGLDPLDRIRERPAYQRLRDLQRDTDALKDEF